MDYSKKEIITFRKTQCIKCNCFNDCPKTESYCASCPKIFNWKMYKNARGQKEEIEYLDSIKQ